VDAILDRAAFPETKLLALNILEKTVKERWKILPKEQCEGIRGFIVSCKANVDTTDEIYVSPTCDPDG
jgi:exportin-1